MVKEKIKNANSSLGNKAKAAARYMDEGLSNPDPRAWPGQAGPEDTYIHQTEDPELKQRVIDADAAMSRRTNVFSQLTSIFNEETLIINDIFMDRVPTTSISITFTSDIFVSESLRAIAPAVSTGGRQDIIIELSLVFPPDQHATKLRRLMAELVNHPFVFIYSNKIRNALSISDNENTIFALESGNIRSIPGQPGSVGLDLTLHYFNHRPFSNHFLYNAWLPGQTPETNKQDSASLPEPGENDSDYSEKHSTKAAKEQAYQVAKQLENKRGKNSPVLMPSQSQPWLYFANILEERTPVISNDYSDFVGFKLEKLQYINPPPSAYQGSSMSDLFKLSPSSKEIADLWKMSAGIPEFLLKAATVGQTRDQGQTNDTGDLAKYTHLEDHELATYQLNGKSLKIDDETGLVLAKVLYSECGGKPDKSAWVFWSILTKWFYKSGLSFRDLLFNYSLAIAKKYSDLDGNPTEAALEHNPRMRKRQDLAVASWSDLTNGFYGPNEKQNHRGIPGLAKLVASFRQGKINQPGQLSTSYWAITDWASDQKENVPTMRSWMSRSAASVQQGNKAFAFCPTTGDYFRKDIFIPANAKETTPNNSWKINKGMPVIILPSGVKVESQKPEDQQKDIASTKTKREQEIQKVKEAEKAKAIPVKQDEEPVKDNKDRGAWIRKVESEQGLTYYFRDKNIKNIFYETLGFSISGDKTDQDHGEALKNIVCTGVSVSFGHRLAPIGLLSQKHYSYQFLGAGNKAGQLVFTFAGPEGRNSADALKALLSLAKDNALYFGQMIDTAGSVELLSEDYITGKQNAILALAGIKDVVISNIEEHSIPDAADKYSLIVEFVGQSPRAAEKLQRRFSAPVEVKQKIIKGLLKLIKLSDDRSRLVVSPEIASENPASFTDKNRRPYILQNGISPWIAEVAIATKEACRKANNSSVDTAKTKYNASSTITWADKYGDWGARKLIFGSRSKNKEKAIGGPSDIVPVSEASGGVVDVSGTRDSDSGFIIPALIQDNFQNNRAFETWLNDMEIIVRKVKAHLYDEATFRQYFGSAYDDITGSITEGTSGCYEDLLIPSYPGSSVAMPPEFYVYDDSDENPAVSGLSDREKSKTLLRKLLEKEVATHRGLTQQTFAGNLYVSNNFFNIKQNRLGELGRKTGELQDFEENNLFSEGALAWEPVFHRNGYDDEQFNNQQTKAWQVMVNKEYSGSIVDFMLSGGSGSSDKTLFNYLDRVNQLLPHLNEQRKWSLGNDAERYVKSSFGDDYNAISFGPNIANMQADATKNGVPTTDATELTLQRLFGKQSPVQVGSIAGDTTPLPSVFNDPIEYPGITMHNGSVTIGQTEAEKEALETNILSEAGAAITDLTGADSESSLFPKAAGLLAATAAINPLLIPVVSPFVAIAAAVDLYDASQTATQEQKKTALATLNDGYKKLNPSLYNKESVDILAEESLAFALGNRAKDVNFRRAFPTFRIYFIEDDSNDSYISQGKVIRAFDDFYSYSAIEEIRIVKSKDIAADLAIIRMANLGNNLLSKRFGDSEDIRTYENGSVEESRLREQHGIFSETDSEDPFEKFVFQDGIKIQIRLGYNDSPDLLESVFLGQIVETALSADGKLLEIVCQGYGAELENAELGADESSDKVFFSSQSVLSAAMIQPTIVNFGRRDLNAAYNPGEIRNYLTGGGGQNFWQQSQVEDWARGKLDKYLQKYTFLNEPQDDNIFAPSPSTYTTWWERFWNNACVYRPIRQTAWEIFKEHELRHPGYISAAVPYGHSTRMTMFFGSKSQHYWSKPSTQLEILMSEGAKEQALRARGFLVKSPGDAGLVVNKINELAKTMPSLAEAMLRDIVSNSSAVGSSIELGKAFGRYVPFRNIHCLDSNTHIISNTTRCSSDNVCNEVEIAYFENEDFAYDPGDAREAMANNDSEIYSVKLDDNIPEDKIKTYHDEYPSCITKYMAKRYAQGLFQRILIEAYSGEITIIGDETIKPYDVCLINDRMSMMTGPVEVKEVIHLFNRNEGYVSIITPGLCVSANEGFDTPIINSMILMNNLLNNYLDTSSFAFNHPIATSIATSAPIIWPMFYMLATQEGTPVFTHPLMFAGKPFIPSALKKSGNLYTSTLGRWKQWWDDLGTAWDKLDVSEELYKSRVEVVESILKWLSEE